MNTIFKISPSFKTKPWGGDHLQQFLSTPNHENIGEMILLSSIDQFPTYITSGEHKGMLFSDYWKSIGMKQYEQSTHKQAFPFLLKILSTKEPLSLQTHPSGAYLKDKFNRDETGKLEAWIILDTEENAKIYFGLKNEYPTSILKDIETMPNPLSLFNQYTPQIGNSYKIEPGIIHGTEGSILLYEIQEPSDYTFRIYDFNRGRELHIEDALKVIKKVEPIISDWNKPLNVDLFQTNVVHIQQNISYRIEKIFEVLTYFGPEAKLYGEFGEFDVSWGDTFFCWKDLSLSLAIKERSNTSVSTLPLISEKEARLFISSSLEQ